MSATSLPITSTLDPQQDRLLRRSDVEFIVGLGRSSIYAAVAAGTFPAPVHVTQRAVAWRKSAIDAWLASRQSARPDSLDGADTAGALISVAPAASVLTHPVATQTDRMVRKPRAPAVASTRTAAAARRAPNSTRSPRSAGRATA